MQSIKKNCRHPECIPATVGPRYGARRINVVAACWPSHMVVVHEVHAAWKSAHTLCNVCAGFHVMYIHEIGEEKNYQYQASFLCVRFSKEKGVGEKRLVFVSKNILVYTDDPKEGNCQMPRYKFEVNTQCFFFCPTH